MSALASARPCPWGGRAPTGTRRAAGAFAAAAEPEVLGVGCVAAASCLLPRLLSLLQLLGDRRSHSCLLLLLLSPTHLNRHDVAECRQQPVECLVPGVHPAIELAARRRRRGSRNLAACCSSRGAAVSPTGLCYCSAASCSQPHTHLSCRRRRRRPWRTAWARWGSRPAAPLRASSRRKTAPPRAAATAPAGPHTWLECSSSSSSSSIGGEA